LGRGAALHLAHEPVAEGFVPAPQGRQDQFVLRLEVLVEGHLGDARLRQHFVDTGGMITAFGEQPLSGLHQMVPSARAHVDLSLGPKVIQTDLCEYIAIQGKKTSPSWNTVAAVHREHA
jgi:hypothetical protein